MSELTTPFSVAFPLIFKVEDEFVGLAVTFIVLDVDVTLYDVVEEEKEATEPELTLSEAKVDTLEAG
jgi:hypothetical protein